MAENPQDPSSPKSIYEKCIICKNQTFIKKNQSIHTRSCYVEGLGQLCHSCFFATTNTSTTYNTTYNIDSHNIDYDYIYTDTMNN